MATKASENATMVENTTKKSTTTKSKTKIKKEITGPKKNFILDTNVILHDFEAINNFEENDIYIPFIVLEELDKFKKGSEQINYNARAFVRELDLITDDDLFTSGAELGLGKGKLYIVNASKDNKKITDAFPERSPDNRILSVLSEIAEKNPGMKTILVSKDINLRMKARSLGFLAEDYINDKVTDVNIFDTGEHVVESFDPDMIDRIYAQPGGVDVSEFNFEFQLNPNHCFILKSERNSVLVRYNPFTQKIKKVEKDVNFGIHPRNAEQTFAFEVLNDPDIKLVGLTGKAGTGKTLLALASALKQNKTYSQILLARPIVSLSNRDLGYLPGDEKQKVAPYMQPLFDNLNVIKSQLGQNSPDLRLIDELQKTGRLEIEALAFIRGRSLTETFCIIDEAQNLTPHEVKTIITRAGENTKMVFTGDLQQIDSPYLDMQSNGLAYMIDKMRGQNIFGHVNLVKGERSELSELASNLL
ncbi:PhoH-like protein [Fermentimonas caenicola]|jgi:PhoH-like ATPase|uniref:PhoH-like protein n=1 Tax=Fermentimonas caenicola TaxID=1562970 RepID=A0A098BYF8_9BACT|nr:MULTISPECIES: PhoH family protein [Lascolabacillus]MDI9624882.1 PhoH family protein [Bacteroidota bacterium]CEA15198.1 PhoH-like protein [Fermentimonas caenicola]MDD2607781.1 PhoH family protein [Lascolabacillus sp.]MDD3658692.1 PhoH family protein [Lascolabacillus sp.]MDD4758801.1 PhoH family protein [Lascolabacillus sp.]